MGKVLRGYAKDNNGNFILIGTISVPPQQGQTISKGTQGQKTFGQTRRNYL
jgi:hypothetical protein